MSVRTLANQCDILRETLVRKNQRYGNSFDKLMDKFHRDQNVVALLRLYDKMNRLETILLDGVEEDDESILDTLLDLAGYALLIRDYFDRHGYNTPDKPTLKEVLLGKPEVSGGEDDEEGRSKGYGEGHRK